jgi:hypothetical protein
MGSSYHGLIPFLSLFCGCQSRRPGSIQFRLIGWRLETRFDYYSESKSKLCYDRRSVGQSVLASSTHLELTTRFILLSVAGLLMWGALSDDRKGLPFTIVAGPRQRSHSRVRVPRDSWPYFTVSDSRLPNLEGQVPVFISPRNRVAPLYPQALGSLFVTSYDSLSYGGVSEPASTRNERLEGRCLPTRRPNWLSAEHFLTTTLHKPHGKHSLYC